MRILYLNPMDYGTNPGVDAIAHGLDHRVRQAGAELRVVFAHFTRPDALEIQLNAIEAAIRGGIDAIVLYVLDPTQPAAMVAQARAQGIPVFTFERPRYVVDGSLVYPNFNQGVYMAEDLASALPAGARVAVIGGPKIIDDEELLAGIVHGVDHSGLTRVNDPTLDRYRNESDVRPGGREVAMRILSEFPDLEGMVPFNDETMLGTLDALDELGGRSVKLVSRNGTPLAVQAVREGRSLGTWDIDCPVIGAALGDLVLRHLSASDAVEGELALGPIGRMINASNADRWVMWSERIPIAPLKEGLLP